MSGGGYRMLTGLSFWSAGALWAAGTSAAEESVGPAPESEDFLSEETKEMLYNERNLGGIGRQLAREIEKRTQIETRVTVLGYAQRGGKMTSVSLDVATDAPRVLDSDVYRTAEMFFG